MEGLGFHWSVWENWTSKQSRIKFMVRIKDKLKFLSRPVKKYKLSGSLF